MVVVNTYYVHVILSNVIFNKIAKVKKEAELSCYHYGLLYVEFWGKSQFMSFLNEAVTTKCGKIEAYWRLCRCTVSVVLWKTLRGWIQPHQKNTWPYLFCLSPFLPLSPSGWSGSELPRRRNCVITPENNPDPRRLGVSGLHHAFWRHRHSGAIYVTWGNKQTSTQTELRKAGGVYEEEVWRNKIMKKQTDKQSYLFSCTYFDYSFCCFLM